MSEEEYFNRAINRICKDYDYKFASEFKELYMKKDKEIERLNNIIEEQDKELELERKSRQLLTDDLANLCEMSLKKDSIIKEVREYTNDLLKLKENDYFDLVDKSYIKKYLEILEKVEEK